MKKKVLYLACHETMEYDELRTLLELGFDVFSSGVYLDPQTPNNPTESLLNFNIDKDLIEEFKFLHKDTYTSPILPFNLKKEFVDKFDIIFCCHFVEYLSMNWEIFKNKTVIYRSIGLSTPFLEAQKNHFKNNGVFVVRVSPMERYIPNYGGETAIIRASVDENAYNNWSGSLKQVLTVQKRMYRMAPYTRYDIYEAVTSGFPRVLCGRENEELVSQGYVKLNINETELKESYKNSRVYFSGCSRPAPITYTFEQALMTGIPIVSVGPKIANFENKGNGHGELFEHHKIIENGIDGFWSNNIIELRHYLKQLLDDYDLCKQFSIKSREKALQMFSRKTVVNDWNEFFTVNKLI